MALKGGVCFPRGKIIVGGGEIGVDYLWILCYMESRMRLEILAAFLEVMVVAGKNLFDLAFEGMGLEEAEEEKRELGLSVLDLGRSITDIQARQELILQYRALQNIQLTDLQAKVLDAITEDKIEEASLKDLVSAYKILKEKEFLDTGRPTDVKGVMHYLIQMEKEEAAAAKPIDLKVKGAQDGNQTYKTCKKEVDKEDLTEYVPDL